MRPFANGASGRRRPVNAPAPVPGPGRLAAAVFLGGSVGALARYGLAVWVAPVADIPIATLTANLVGSALLGVLAGVAERRARRGVGWEMLGVGFCGAFTTFSTFALEAFDLLDRHGPMISVLYAGGSVAAGLSLAALARRRSLSW